MKLVAPHTGSVNWKFFEIKTMQESLVAPHTGSVNWNFKICVDMKIQIHRSLCGERELKLTQVLMITCNRMIVPHPGSVNWKIKWSFTNTYWFSRSPYGERELKLIMTKSSKLICASLPMRGGELKCCKWCTSFQSDCRSPCGERELKSWA